jgi:hypothetical protein
MISNNSCSFISKEELHFTEQWSLRNFKYERKNSFKEDEYSDISEDGVIRLRRKSTIKDFFCEVVLLIIIVSLILLSFMIAYY